MHYGMLDIGRLNTIGQDKADGRGIEIALISLPLLRQRLKVEKKRSSGGFLAEAQRRFAKYACQHCQLAQWVEHDKFDHGDCQAWCRNDADLR
jgi:hypothetical protein